MRDKMLREKEQAQAERDALDKTMLETKRKRKDLAKAEKKAKVNRNCPPSGCMLLISLERAWHIVSHSPALSLSMT